MDKIYNDDIMRVKGAFDELTPVDKVEFVRMAMYSDADIYGGIMDEFKPGEDEEDFGYDSDEEKLQYVMDTFFPEAILDEIDHFDIIYYIEHNPTLLHEIITEVGTKRILEILVDNL